MNFEVTGSDDLRFTVISEGEGHPIVILHPGSSDADSWARVSERLAERFRVLRFDRYTYRQALDSGFDAMEAEVADVLAVVDSLDEPPILVGHSSGAIVALEAARTAPARFAGLVLYDPPLAVDGPIGGAALVAARAAIEAGKPGKAMSIFLRDIAHFPRVGVALVQLSIPVWRRLRSYASAQIADTEAIESLGVGIGRYGNIDSPALLITGTLSPKHLQSKIEQLAGTLPNVEALVTIRWGGHGMNTSRPGKLAEAITGFADEVFI